MNFVFTSAGNNTNFDKLWLGKNKKYDVYVIYYGNNDTVYNKYKSNKHIKHIERRKGSKFQNFLYFYNKYPEIISKYDRFFILDDDIIFNVDDINKMFSISREYNLDICGPSFIPPSKLSWSITKHVENRLLTYTNFVEVNTMLFNKNALINLMKYMVPELIGWGIDIMAICANGVKKNNNYAIIHCVKCINPDDNIKGIKTRELNKILNADIRAELFKNYIKQTNLYKEIINFKPTEYESLQLRYNELNKLYSKSFKSKSSITLRFLK